MVGSTEFSSKMQLQAWRSWVDGSPDQTSGTSTPETSTSRLTIATGVDESVSSVTVDVVTSVTVATDVAPILVVST